MVAADHNRLISNQGASAKVYITLPDNSAVGYSSGQFFRALVAVQNANGIRVKAQNPQTITLGGYAPGAAAGYIESARVGAYVVLCSINGTEWYAEAVHGQWTVDGAAPAQRSTGLESLLASTVVDLSLSTKQPLYTVPAGQHLVVTKTASRNLSASLSTAAGGIGYNAGSDDVCSDATFLLPDVTSTYSVTSNIAGASNAAKIGAAADVLGFKTTATQAATTVTIDIFGYLF